MHNHRNDSYVMFKKAADMDNTLRTVTTTKHPASLMSLGFVASNGLVTPSIWFPVCYRLTATEYVSILE